MSDEWFETGLHQLMLDASEDSGLAYNEVLKVYGFLSDVGLIDYDVEKEIIWERYYGDEDEA